MAHKGHRDAGMCAKCVLKFDNDCTCISVFERQTTDFIYLYVYLPERTDKQQTKNKIENILPQCLNVKRLRKMEIKVTTL